MNINDDRKYLHAWGITPEDIPEPEPQYFAPEDVEHAEISTADLAMLMGTNRMLGAQLDNTRADLVRSRASNAFISGQRSQLTIENAEMHTACRTFRAERDEARRWRNRFALLAGIAAILGLAETLVAMGVL